MMASRSPFRRWAGWPARGLMLVLGLCLLLPLWGIGATAREDVLSTLFRQHGAVMLFIDPQSGEIVDANLAAGQFYGLPAEKLRGRSIQEFNLLPPEEVAAERQRAQSEHRSYFVFPHRVAGEEVRTVEVYSSPIRLESGRLVLFSIIHDVSGKRIADAELLAYKSRLEELVARRTAEVLTAETRLRWLLIGALVVQALVIAALVVTVVARRRAQRGLARREEELRTLIDAMPDFVCFKDAQGRWLKANPPCVALFELPEQTFVGKTDAELAELQPRYRDVLLGCTTTDEATWAAGSTLRVEERIDRGSEAIVLDVIKVPLFEADGSRKGLVMIGRDITERKAAEARIERLAFYDSLTGLPNRRLLLDRLDTALTMARRNQRHGAVLLIDLDYFKTLNDARGHAAGDQLLEAVAGRLSACIGVGDSVARIGGDEFAVLLPDLAAHEGLAADAARGLAERVRAILSAPFSLQGEDVGLGASIGVCLFPGGGIETASDCVKQADTAMYQAKDAGRNQVRFFERAMQERVEARFALEADLRQALPRGELRLFLQIQVDGAGEFVGAEVLLRWLHRERGLVPPGVFIPLAEETGLIMEIGEWVLAESCRLLARAEAAGRPVRLAVNVSPSQFHRGDFVERTRRILAETGADPARLTMEVTEGLVINDVHQAIATMSELAAMGIHFAIDDFGTGYSSLAYLKRLPINEIKIDKTFVQDAPTDINDAALIDAVLAVARHLHLKVVAEGVETEAQAEFLRARGVGVFQGYLFGKPQPADQVLEPLLPGLPL